MKKEPIIKNTSKQDKLLEAFRKHFPNCLLKNTDGNFVIDRQKLQLAISPKDWGKSDGEEAMITDIIEEGFELRWVGKKEAYHNAYSHCKKILQPLPKESVNFETTKNILLKGDNLDALKLLQNNYFEKIKMIYIDPPYNTQNDGFIYDNNFKENIDEILAELGYNGEQKNFIKNIAGAKTHSGWLSFMYPRLLLARDLLQDDGVIFISIDDNEQANLKLLCDEVFGESNFVFSLIRKTASNRAMAKYTSTIHEYSLCFAKNKYLSKLEGNNKDFSNYTNPDNDKNGDWVVTDPSRVKGYIYDIQNPHTKRIDTPPKGRGWVFKEEYIKSLLDSNVLIFKKKYKKKERGFILKKYKKDIRSTKNLVNSLEICNNEFLNQAGTKELIDLFNNNVFSFPKPTSLIKFLIKTSTNKNDLILDFFAGSGTTAEAVMQLNAEDGGKRKFILVQLAEPIDKKKNTESYNFVKNELKKKPTTFEICAERIRRAGTKINQKLEQELNTGFKIFELTDDKDNQIYKNLPTATKLDNFSAIQNKTEQTKLLYNLMLGEGLALSESIKCLLKNCLFKVANRFFILNNFDLSKYKNLLADKEVDFVCIYGMGVKVDNFAYELCNYFQPDRIKVKF